MTTIKNKLITHKDKDGKTEYFEVRDVGKDKYSVTDVVRLAFQDSSSHSWVKG